MEMRKGESQKLGKFETKNKIERKVEIKEKKCLKLVNGKM